ncbi:MULTISPECIES: acetylxylan esterase [unclassified Pseudonocardia]|uniref:glucuronyl esterase domain-containing protein n=1 Tax=unclassified Pseudonocardia TaxID=2619320 RepID=UPI00095AB698|nr:MULTISPECIES: acetylxylan esterase [unclassified Pseudonocardia]OLL73655.1 Glycoprotein gp2 [Pseudonocardia sp. Ae150A_Ps1]OLL86231.1 Glycoprotein gp2 [Pseudonocardia sp. Ae263_Ps1]OLL93738.1 Glycoprotein gp2 [Pseudonocardia sp. Ae356_Ps1]
MPAPRTRGPGPGPTTPRRPASGATGAAALVVALVAAAAVLPAAGSSRPGTEPPPWHTTAAVVPQTSGVRAEPPDGDDAVPDPLVLDDGARVDDIATWENRRRPELLAAFREHVYGQSLPEPLDMTVDDGAGPAAPGAARRVTIGVTGPEGTAEFTLRTFVPGQGRPKGTFLLIDHRGSVGDDPGSTSGYAPVATILDAEEVAPDDPAGYRNGVIDAFFPAGEDLPADAGRTISAWAWGASRAMDVLETDPAIDPSTVAVIGHSRGGKAALWAGAQDPRFPVVISNNSGAAGAKSARRDGSGESIAAITEQFPHWFPETYRRYAGDAGSLPVDQNQLLALIAPGRVVVGSATEDANADPQGEFLSYLGAAPVYDLYGLGDTGLPSRSWPPAENEVFRRPGMSYHLRSGGHGLEDADWERYLDGDLFRR